MNLNIIKAFVVTLLGSATVAFSSLAGQEIEVGADGDKENETPIVTTRVGGANPIDLEDPYKALMVGHIRVWLESDLNSIELGLLYDLSRVIRSCPSVSELDDILGRERALQAKLEAELVGPTAKMEQMNESLQSGLEKLESYGIRLKRFKAELYRLATLLEIKGLTSRPIVMPLGMSETKRVYESENGSGSFERMEQAKGNISDLLDSMQQRLQADINSRRSPSSFLVPKLRAHDRFRGEIWATISKEESVPVTVGEKPRMSLTKTRAKLLEDSYSEQDVPKGFFASAISSLMGNLAAVDEGRAAKRVLERLQAETFQLDEIIEELYEHDKMVVEYKTLRDSSFEKQRQIASSQGTVALYEQCVATYREVSARMDRMNNPAPSDIRGWKFKLQPFSQRAN